MMLDTNVSGFSIFPENEYTLISGTFFFSRPRSRALFPRGFLPLSLSLSLSLALSLSLVHTFTRRRRTHARGGWRHHGRRRVASPCWRDRGDGVRTTHTHRHDGRCPFGTTLSRRSPQEQNGRCARRGQCFLVSFCFVCVGRARPRFCAP